jgi:hypothetical protein
VEEMPSVQKVWGAQAAGKFKLVFGPMVSMKKQN